MGTMLLCIFLGPKFIEFLRLREFGQQIREEGPEEHHEKAGTPTMGGLLIITAVAIPYLVLSDRDTQSLAVFGVALGCAAIGFVDDYLKITRRRSLGLSARYKLLLQLGLALGLWYVRRPPLAAPRAPLHAAPPGRPARGSLQRPPPLGRPRLEPRAADLACVARH